MTTLLSRKHLFMTLLCSLPVTSSFAEEVDLFAMSLEKLATVKISVASTRAENILKAPAVVSRINVAQLQHMGVHSLEQIISMLPGVQVQDTAIGSKAIMIRGVFEAFNQKVLFQLNGVPYWQPAHGDNPLLGIPVESISHIEVIRGSGAVFHGSNASAGVINIVTKTGTASSFLGSVSSDDDRGLEFHHGTDVGTGQLTVSGHWRDGKTYDAFFSARPAPPFYPPGTPTEGTIEKQQSSKSIQIRWQKEGFSAQYHEFRSANSGLAAVAAITNLSEMRQTGRLLHLSNKWSFNSSELELFGDYNNYFLEIPTDNLFAGVVDGVQNFGSGSENHRTRFGGKFVKQLSTGSEMVFGAEVEERSTGDYRNSDGFNPSVITLPASDTFEWSMYSQWLADIDKYRFSVGFRYVDNEKAGSNFLPRISGIYALTDNSSIKLIYSTGFNSPNLTQQGIDIPPNVIKGDPDLEAETIETLDLAYTYNHNNSLLIFNVYYLEANDFIQRQASDFAVKFANVGNFERQGFELDYQYASNRLHWYSNIAYHDDGDSAIEEDHARLLVPRWMASLGASWVLTGPHSVGSSYQFQSSRAAADDSHYLNIQYQYTGRHVELMLGVDNLLGDNFRVADIQDLNPDRLIGSGDEDPLYRMSVRWRW